MLNYQQMEFLTYERQHEFLAEAEQRRLWKSLPALRSSQAQRIAGWVGSQLVQWGEKLQGPVEQSVRQVTPELLPIYK